MNADDERFLDDVKLKMLPGQTIPIDHATISKFCEWFDRLLTIISSLREELKDRDRKVSPREHQLQKALDDMRTSKDAEIERLRIQLAACGVAAMQNTEESKKQRIGRDNPYWSASYGDVCDTVDREMSLREEVKESKSAGAVEALEKAQERAFEHKNCRKDGEAHEGAGCETQSIFDLEIIKESYAAKPEVRS